MTDEPEVSSRKPDSAEPNLDFATYWAIIVERRRLIALSVIVAVAFAVVVTLLSKPLYMATVLLNVERDQRSALDLGQSPGWSPPEAEFLPTQRDLMASREVAERVVKRLRLLDNPEFNPSATPVAATKAPAARDYGGAASMVQSSVATRQRRGTNLIELSVVSRSPKLAADIANAVAESYIEWNIEAKYLVVGQASKFLTAQIEQLKGEIQAKENELQAYGRQKDIVSTDPNSNATMQKLSSFNRDYAEAVADRVAKDARYRELQTARPEAIADNLSSGLVSQLRNEQARMERDYAEKLNLYKPTWPAMQQARAEIEKGKQHLDSVIEETVAKARANARTDYMTALRREQSLKAVLEGQTSEAMTLNSNAVEYNNLKTEVETKRALMDTLLKRQAETEVTSRLSGERVSNVRIVDRALVPGGPFKPSMKKNVFVGTVLGAGFGLVLAFCLHYLDRSLRSLEQVERILQVPALGLIPAASGNSDDVYGTPYGGKQKKPKRRLTTAGAPTIPIELLPHTHARSTIAEAYRSFRTSLLLSRAGGLRSMVITSVMPGEGKTATATNLAVVLAQLNKRVLLIDADLHRPRVHEVFGISNRTGLVTLLADNADPESVTVPTVVPGLFVMPAGPSSPNPSGLLSSETMRLFMERAITEFDYIIVDTPPLGPVADAMILGSHTDGVVLCVKGGKTPHERVRAVRDRLVRSNVRLLGVVLNNVDVSSSPYQQYYGSYESSYGDQAQRATG
jgi:succinoglycan biosynthesis transport protein ExoP